LLSFSSRSLLEASQYCETTTSASLIEFIDLFEFLVLTKESEKLLHYLFINLHEIEPSITLDEIKFVHALFSSRSYGIKALSNYFSQQRETNLFSILSTETNLNQEEQILSDINAEQSLSCLVPFSDFFNHDCDTKVEL
jgi:hypothetical protein